MWPMAQLHLTGEGRYELLRFPRESMHGQALGSSALVRILACAEEPFTVATACFVSAQLRAEADEPPNPAPGADAPRAWRDALRHAFR